MKKPNPITAVYTKLPTGIKAAIIIVMIVAGSYVFLNVIKYAKNFLKRPANVPPPPDIPTNGNTGVNGAQSEFNPQSYTDAVYQDIYENAGVRNTQAYNDLLALSNTNLVQVYNDWSHRYYSKGSETLTQAIAGEWGFWYNSFANVRDTLVEKLKSLNCP